MALATKRVLFVIRAVEHYPYFRSIVEALVGRGHQVRVLFDRTWSMQTSFDVNHSNVKGVIFDWAVDYRGQLRKVVFRLRDLASYVRYLKIQGQSSFYQDRWRKMLFGPFQVLLQIPGVNFFLTTNFSAKLLTFLEKITPPVGEVVGDIECFAPNVVVASPVNMPYSSADLEYLKAAKSIGIPSALPVFSWDNLTTKGLIHIAPDVLLVWNQRQVSEAWKHHQISKKLIKVCGAFLFDFWFDNLGPSQTREAFCKKWSLPVNKPILCYLETSNSLTGDERWLVKELSFNLKNSHDLRLKTTQIIVRPHPFKSYFDNFKLPNVYVIPERGTWPKDRESIQLYFDTLYFSFAVFGVNTSGFIDAVCCDKPIVTLNLKEYEKTQVETEHFRHLVENDVVEIANSRQDLTKILGKLLVGGDRRGLQRRRFVEKFIRPNGLEKAAGEVAAREIEKIAS